MLKLKKLFSCILAFTTILGGSMIMTNAVNENNEIKYAHILDKQAYYGDDLGATYSKSSTTFKVWAPTASGVAVKLYKTGSSDEVGAQDISTTLMTKGDNGVWSVKLNGDRKNLYYTYLVTVDGVTKETADVYAKAAGVNGNRSMIVDLDSTDPQGWNDDKHIFYDDPTDAIVWEVHIKDFSSSEVSGVSLKHKGKYLAFTENGTTLDSKGEIPTCIDYLKQLGVTHVQLLPVYDYATVDETDSESEQFNWGYDPKNYNVPEGSYSTNPFDGNVRINEFKQMIKALHNAGIGVIMDVVYNHMYSAEGSWFDSTVPGYYFRQKSDGTLSDGSGCGNETASEHLMYRKFMIDSILYWVDEYHIDGFRFDLMGIHDVETINGIRKALDEKVKDGKKIIMYGEPWTGGELGTTVDTCVKSNIKKLDSRIGAFNDDYRDAVKGHVFNALEQGFIQSGSDKTALQAGIAANSLSGEWANQPSQTVTYTSAHDNYTLYDKLVLSVKNDMSYNKRDDMLIDMNKMAATLTLTSQGIIFMQSGEEFARTKFGDSNSYISPDSINQLNWNNVREYADLVSYYSGLIEIRKNFKPFRDATTKSANLIKFSDTDSGVVAYTLENTLTSNTEWKYVAVIVNANDTETTANLLSQSGQTLPDKWTIIADKSETGLNSLGTVNGNEVKIPPCSAMVLADKESFDKLAILSESCTVKVEYKDTDSGEVLYTRAYKGKEGNKYHIAENNSIGVEYDLESISGDTEGVFTKEYQTVTYNYKKYNGNILNLNISYMQQGDEFLGSGDREAAPSVIQRIREGSDYSAMIKSIDGMELDLSKFPSNAVGKAESEDIYITYYYKDKEKTDLVVHYYNSNNWNNIGAYIYRKIGDDTKEYSGKFPGEQMKSDLSIGENWYTIVIKDAGNLDGMYVQFTDMEEKFNTDLNELGYKISGEVWINNSTVENSGEVNVIRMKSDGTVLETEKLSGKIGTGYSIPESEIEGLKLTAKTSNTQGKYSENPVYVIYSYEEKNFIKKPNLRTGLILCATSALTLSAAGIAYLIYRRKKR